MDDVLVTAGGIIPDEDIPELKEAGVAEVFGPGHEHRPGRRLPARATSRRARRDDASRGEPRRSRSQRRRGRATAGRWRGC